MAPRTSATFAKRQKERARQEKQQAKQQRKLQRKLEKREAPPDSESGEFGSIMEVAFHAEAPSDNAATSTEAALNEKEPQ